MALKDLKSDLSWYGKKKPGPYKPNVDYNDTKFTNDNGIPGVSITGYSPKGNSSVGFRQVAAGDGFAIDNVSFSDRGSASRKAQLGVGSPFLKDTGWHTTSRYSDAVKKLDLNDRNNPILTSGLAFKYTANSPIDDMYNKFKVREEAYDPYGYAKPPFILRGIQRDDKTEPQRWGTPGVFDIPRGGVVTAAERAALDAVRIGKFLIRPAGISFLAKQVGLQLTNPNTEGIDGTAKTNTFMTKLYDPLSSITNAVGGTLGLRTDRHFPPLVRSSQSTYEGVIKARAALGSTVEISQNRLVKIRKELLGAGGLPGGAGKVLKFFSNLAAKVSGRTGEPISALTGLTGPGSLLGIGATTIRRHITTPDVGTLDSLAEERKDVVNKETGKTTSELNIDYTTGEDYDVNTERKHNQLDSESFKERIEGKDTKYIHETKDPKYTDEEPYLNKLGSDSSGILNGSDNESDIDTDKDSLKTKYTDWGNGKIIGYDRGGRSGQGDGGAGGGIPEQIGIGSIINDYKRMAYGDIPTRTGVKGLKDSRVNHEDFREIVKNDSPGGIKRWDEDTKIDIIDSTIDKSLIKFRIAGINFKAYIGSINDSFAGTWDGQQDQGRADLRYLYTSFERNVNIDFIVPIESKDDYGTVWGNLQKLAQKTFPEYGTEGFHGNSVKVTIGDLYKNKDMIITDLSYDWDNETPWEITDGEQSPMYTNVSISFTVLGTKPTNTSDVYSMKGIA